MTTALTFPSTVLHKSKPKNKTFQAQSPIYLEANQGKAKAEKIIDACETETARNLKIMTQLLMLTQQEYQSSQTSMLKLISQGIKEDTKVSIASKLEQLQPPCTVTGQLSRDKDHRLKMQAKKERTDFQELECVAVDCEFVQSHRKHLLARICLVNEDQQVLLDSFVKPVEVVTNYITFVSGVSPSDVKNAPTWAQLRPKVEKLLKNKIVVGHSTYNDLRVMEMGDWQHFGGIVDIAKFSKFKDLEGRPIGLKRLGLKILNRKIQEGSHCPFEDASTTMQLFKKHRYSILKSQLSNDMEQ